MTNQRAFLEQWEEIWGEDGQVSAAWLTNQIYLEENLAAAQFRATIFSRFAAAPADLRDCVAMEISSAAAAEHSCFERALPLTHALRGEKIGFPDLHRLINAMERQGDLEQRMIWFACCQVPRSSLLLGSAKLMAIRILPKFLGTSTQFQAALEAYLERVLLDLANGCDLLLAGKFDALLEVESGVHWTRLLLSAAAALETEKRSALLVQAQRASVFTREHALHLL